MPWVGLLLAPTLAMPEAGGGGAGLAGMECSERAQLAYVLPRVGLAVCSVGLLVLYAIYYYHDPAGGVLRRREAEGAAQPLPCATGRPSGPLRLTCRPFCGSSHKHHRDRKEIEDGR